MRIASGCNLGCTFCERELLPPGPGKAKQSGIITFVDGREDLNLAKDMTPETWAAVKDKLFEHTGRVELGGLGEPTLGKLFATAAKDIVDAGKALFFFSNGHYLGKRHVLDNVGEAPHVSVSFDAGTAEVYERVRKGDFAAAVAGVKAFRKAKPKAKIDSQFTATTENIGDLANWVRLCVDLGIGLHKNDETLMLVGADHHVTDRVQTSLRFAKDATEAAIAEAREVAQANGVWFVAQLHPFSDVNPNAATDDSDPRGVRRFGDLLAGDFIPCQISLDGAPLMGERLTTPEGEHDYVSVAREMYVDYDGTCWTCLGRHVLGNVHKHTWAQLVDENGFYQEFLHNWLIGKPIQNESTCMVCPRRK